VSRADDVATNSRRLHHGVWADRRTAQQCRHC
jgi:hypothetical protein